jgi:hypothetical protein
VKRWLENAALWLVSLAVTLVILEGTVRWANRIPLASTDNFIYRLHDFFLNNANNQFDPAVGWIARANVPGPHYTTGAYGVRMNEGTIAPLREGGILVVGDSFSVGSEVDDSQTMSAALERLSGLPVLNAGSGGYAPDQSILRAKQLLDIVKPRVIVLDHTEDQMQTLLLTVYAGARRPYFTLARGKLVHHNNPVPPGARQAEDLGTARAILGHSYLVVWSALRLNRESWLGAREVRLQPRRSTYTRVACALLQQFQAEMQPRGITLVWTIRYPGQYIDLPVNQLANLFWIDRCAAEAGYVVVDTYEAFHRLAAASQAEFRKQYNFVGTPPQFSHMSPIGNARVAQLIFDQLKPRLAGAPRNSGSKAP